MRKGDIAEGVIESVRFPNHGIFHAQDEAKTPVMVKNAIPGQRVQVRITKKRNGMAQGNLLKVLEKAPCEQESPCPVFGRCGGCLYLTLPPKEEVRLKERQVRELLTKADPEAARWYQGILESPCTLEYRNKMELTFGDEEKDGPLTLGMHQRGSFYDVTNAGECRIADGDFRMIIQATRDFFAVRQVPFYHRMKKEGYLRHLLIRKGSKTGDILADLVTTTQLSFLEEAKKEQELLEAYMDMLLRLPLTGRLCGILHTVNDSVADVVENQGTQILYGSDCFEEELLGLTFTVSPFSFFQTNSLGAELLYETAAHMIQTYALPKEGEKPLIYDLYCGTGTISLLMAGAARWVIGVEIVEEAASAARENARRNKVTNCTFIAGDVLKVLDEIEEKPDLIILDPPRDGVHPKALKKILAYGVSFILYISCKPTSLARDLPLMRQAGYLPVCGVSVNQFPKTANVETVVLMSIKDRKPDTHINVSLDMDDYHRIIGDEEEPEA